MRVSLAAAAAGALALGLAACGGDKKSTDSGAAGSKAKTISLLLPESKTTRYDQQDKPLFEAKLKELCPNCTLSYQNADQDAAKTRIGASPSFSTGRLESRWPSSGSACARCRSANTWR